MSCGQGDLNEWPPSAGKGCNPTTAKGGVISAFTVSHNGQQDVPLTAPRKEPRSVERPGLWAVAPPCLCPVM